MVGGDSERKSWIGVIVGAAFIALLSARPYAGGWNDGSRLATVESLVDRHTLAIDDSMFVKVAGVATSPYEMGIMRDPRRPRDLLGTLDKLWIDGHWYSDKSPVPALLMAALYQLLQWITGLTASVHPQAFCYLMTVFSSGAAYVAAVAGIYHLAKTLQLSMLLRLAVTVSFALGTLALIYVRYVNNHILLLGVAILLLTCHVRLTNVGTARLRTLLSLGTLAGFAYTIDLGVGPPLWLGSLMLAAWRTRSLKAVAVITFAALPWLAAHHGVNYATGGTFKPANAVPEYLAWPRSPFQTNLTGQWNHNDLGQFASYALQLQIGKKGFLGHNLPLLLALPAGCYLLRKKITYWPEVLYCLGVSGGVWLVYAAGSTNYAGACCSIRWFVPLIGLGYLLLILLLRDLPSAAADFGILTAGGIALMFSAWAEGPWRLHLLPGHWPVLGLTVGAWATYRWRIGWTGQGGSSKDHAAAMARAA